VVALRVPHPLPRGRHVPRPVAVRPHPLQPYEGLTDRELPRPVGPHLRTAVQPTPVANVVPADVRRQTPRYERVPPVGREDLVHPPQQRLPRGRNPLVRHPQFPATDFTATDTGVAPPTSSSVSPAVAGASPN